MKRIVYPVLIALILFTVTTGCESPSAGGETSLDSQIDSVSYSLGFLYGQNLAQGGVESLEDDKFLTGLNRALNRDESQIDDIAMQSLMQRYQEEISQTAQTRREGQAAANIEEANQFLEENAQNEGVSVTDSGLQYRVIEEGTGDRPTEADEVEVHYRGTLISGEEFDSSHSRNQTATFPLGGVIPGWTEGLQLMREGATYEFFIPAELAYGNNPPPGSIIEPGAVLIFEVELIDIKN